MKPFKKKSWGINDKKVCHGRDLAKALAQLTLSNAEAAAWARELRAARLSAAAIVMSAEAHRKAREKLPLPSALKMLGQSAKKFKKEKSSAPIHLPPQFNPSKRKPRPTTGTSVRGDFNAQMDQIFREIPAEGKQPKIDLARILSEEREERLSVVRGKLKGEEQIITELQAAEGGAWSGAELRKEFGLSLADLRRRRAKYLIVYWQDARGVYFYPHWQFRRNGVLLPGVAQVLQIFRSKDQWRIMRYFLAPRQQLSGRRPLDLLRAGEIVKVLNHARMHNAENTW
jgi:hypothetical protein